ncbi:MAG: hypothetical protein ACJ8DV_05540 [Microvirga sp.]
MKPLVLSSEPCPSFTEGGFADLGLCLALFRFISGPPPSSDELAAYLGPRNASHEHQGKHWSGWGGYWKDSKNKKHRDLSLPDFSQHYDTIELWFDVRPWAQLQLIWLLDYFRAHPEAATKMKLRLVDRDLIWSGPGGIGDWRPPIVDVTKKELSTASAAWQAYRSPTPEACVDLLQQDLSALPLLRPVLLKLLAERPSASSGLGATEMRMLEMIGRGYSRTYDLFYLWDVRQTRVFDEPQLGYLLEGLAFGPTPAIVGLDEQLRTMRREIVRDRDDAYRRSNLSLTDFGKAVVAHKEDFSRHNPIDRWWGGTHLTNDSLWRWNPALLKP